MGRCFLGNHTAVGERTVEKGTVTVGQFAACFRHFVGKEHPAGLVLLTAEAAEQLFFLHPLRLLSNHLPRFHQTGQLPGGIGRTGGGQQPGFQTRAGLLVLLIQPVGCGAVAEDGFNGGMVQNPGQVRGDRVPDGGIRGPDNFAPLDDVPQGQSVVQNQAALFLDGLRYGTAKDGGQDFPEAVLGMVIEKHPLPGFHRREAAENQHPGPLVEQRRQGMLDRHRRSAASRASTASGLVAQEVTKRTAVWVSLTAAQCSKLNSCSSRAIWLFSRMGHS